MKTTTYGALIAATTPLKFVRIATNKHLEKLNPDEYFAIMVEDNPYSKNPHIKGIEATTHRGLVGIEKTSGENGYYISKNYHSRSDWRRGTTVIVECTTNFLKECRILS